MSVTAPDARLLPFHRRPPEWGGEGRDPVFGMPIASLGDSLHVRQEPDGSTHWLVEPAHVMPASRFITDLWTSRDHWYLEKPR